MLSALVPFVLGSAPLVPCVPPEDELLFVPDVFGLERDASDVEATAALYEALGFTRKEVVGSSRSIVLVQGAFHLVLRPSDAPAPTEGSARFSLNLAVGDLDAALASAKAAGARVPVETPHEFPLGLSVEVFDSAGHALHLMDLEGDEPPSAPRIFNVGCNLLDWEAVETTFADLGFEVFSRDYLPLALPLERAGAAPLVLHASAERAVDARALGERLLLGTRSLDDARAALLERGFPLGEAPFASGPLGRTLAFTGAAGIGFRLLERSDAQLAFERMKSLAGRWIGTSSQGWESQIVYEPIAGGSAVMQSTLFEAHPGQKMLTLAHMDGPDLVLKHYCVAGNQPEIVLAGCSPDRTELRFEFRRATNLASREHGHMDKAVFRFENEDAFSETWTWYQAGAEQWLEEIKYRRVGEGSGH